jgi:hypothetical protein
MSRDKGKDKAQGKGGARKLAVKKDAVKDLEPKRGVKGGKATRTAEWMRHAANHNETLARDTARKRAAKK